MAEWREVKGYEGLYLVSNEGQIYSLPRIVNNGRGEYLREGRVLSSGLRGKSGIMYEFVSLSNETAIRHEAVHRLVASAFVDNPNNYPVVNHIDRNTLNNRADNLEWCDTQYNNEYSHNKKIAQYDRNGNKIAVYKSIKHASEITKISRTSINNALTGWSATAGKYFWKYEEE